MLPTQRQNRLGSPSASTLQPSPSPIVLIRHYLHATNVHLARIDSETPPTTTTRPRPACYRRNDRIAWEVRPRRISNQLQVQSSSSVTTYMPQRSISSELTWKHRRQLPLAPSPRTTDATTESLRKSVRVECPANSKSNRPLPSLLTRHKRPSGQN